MKPLPKRPEFRNAHFDSSKSMRIEIDSSRPSWNSVRKGHGAGCGRDGCWNGGEMTFLIDLKGRLTIYRSIHRVFNAIQHRNEIKTEPNKTRQWIEAKSNAKSKPNQLDGLDWKCRLNQVRNGFVHITNWMKIDTNFDKWSGELVNWLRTIRLDLPKKNQFIQILKWMKMDANFRKDIQSNWINPN